MANRSIRTPEKDQQFFEAIERNGGNVSKSCLEVLYPKTSVYEWRRKDEQFATDFNAAVQRGIDTLHDELIRRAFEGCEKPVFQQGRQVGTITEYSDTLGIFLLKGHRPDQFRERVTTRVEFEDATPEQLEDAIANMSTAQLKAILAKRRSNDRG